MAAATPFAGRNLFDRLDFRHLPARIGASHQPGQPHDPADDEIGRNLAPRREQGFSTGTTHGDHLNSRAGAFDGVLQVEGDLAGLDPKQMVPDAFVIPFGDADREDIDVPCHNLQRAFALVEKLRMTAIEHDAGRRRTRRALIGRGRPLEEAFVHSWATSFA